MAATSPCIPCCTTPQTVNVPGVQGADGTNGTDGSNAYTLTNGASTVPAAAGAQINPLTVDNSAWMAVGQIVVISGPSTYRVVSVPTDTTVVLEWLQYPGDVAPLTAIADNATVSPAGRLITITAISVYGAGTAYQITTTAAKVDLGTTDPVLTITQAGTWLLFARARVDYTAATFAAVRNVTLKLRRTNNTAADVTNATTTFKTEIITTLTYTANIVQIPLVAYVTANNDDLIEMWAGIDTGPTAGSIDVVEAEIIAVRIA